MQVGGVLDCQVGRFTPGRRAGAVRAVAAGARQDGIVVHRLIRKAGGGRGVKKFVGWLQAPLHAHLLQGRVAADGRRSPSVGGERGQVAVGLGVQFRQGPQEGDNGPDLVASVAGRPRRHGAEFNAVFDDGVEFAIGELTQHLRQILRRGAHRQGDHRLAETRTAVAIGADHIVMLRP